MQTINITGVPEHFNFPWKKIIESQPISEVELKWIDEPRGSGAMNQAIREEITDLAIILTESFIKDVSEGNKGKIIGFHVQSPLTWGIHIPAAAPVEDISQLKDTPFLISRYGSGSHLMAYLLTKQHQWDPKSLQFDIIHNLEGAREAFKSGEVRTFLWEKFTTKPYVDKGEMKRIGEIPTPWPCFVIVASAAALEKYPEQIKAIQKELYKISALIQEEKKSFTDQISLYYQIKPADIEAWLEQTEWAIDASISKAALEQTMQILLDLDLIDNKMTLDELVAEDFVELI
ncbi:type 2 periplasmic-binding domain-containing protein [Anditalea andensis]|uniref:ABC transporter substrate-binding protein n=1 Tax=Anditalea andensis TaxID=1048983 RepID=A0A074L652_9BACT|nr:ABC transporter substrate-binding protein [Anditalea andensis]KEO75318.1 ABC transporter substrate-binding protein [Anditalea andensis]